MGLGLLVLVAALLAIPFFGVFQLDSASAYFASLTGGVNLASFAMFGLLPVLTAGLLIVRHNFFFFCYVLQSVFLLSYFNVASLSEASSSDVVIIGLIVASFFLVLNRNFVYPFLTSKKRGWRRFARKPVGKDCEINVFGQVVDAKIIDISLNGLKVEINNHEFIDALANVKDFMRVSFHIDGKAHALKVVPSRFEEGSNIVAFHSVDFSKMDDLLASLSSTFEFESWAEKQAFIGQYRRMMLMITLGSFAFASFFEACSTQDFSSNKSGRKVAGMENYKHDETVYSGKGGPTIKTNPGKEMSDDEFKKYLDTLDPSMREFVISARESEKNSRSVQGFGLFDDPCLDSYKQCVLNYDPNCWTVPNFKTCYDPAGQVDYYNDEYTFVNFDPAQFSDQAYSALMYATTKMTFDEKVPVSLVAPQVRKNTSIFDWTQIPDKDGYDNVAKSMGGLPSPFKHIRDSGASMANAVGLIREGGYGGVDTMYADGTCLSCHVGAVDGLIVGGMQNKHIMPIDSVLLLNSPHMRNLAVAALSASAGGPNGLAAYDAAAHFAGSFVLQIFKDIETRGVIAGPFLSFGFYSLLENPSDIDSGMDDVLQQPAPQWSIFDAGSAAATDFYKHSVLNLEGYSSASVPVAMSHDSSVDGTLWYPYAGWTYNSGSYQNVYNGTENRRRILVDEATVTQPSMFDDLFGKNFIPHANTRPWWLLKYNDRRVSNGVPDRFSKDLDPAVGWVSIDWFQQPGGHTEGPCKNTDFYSGLPDWCPNNEFITGGLGLQTDLTANVVVPAFGPNVPKWEDTVATDDAGNALVDENGNVQVIPGRVTKVDAMYQYALETVSPDIRDTRTWKAKVAADPSYDFNPRAVEMGRALFHGEVELVAEHGKVLQCAECHGTYTPTGANGWSTAERAWKVSNNLIFDGANNGAYGYREQIENPNTDQYYNDVLEEMLPAGAHIQQYLQATNVHAPHKRAPVASFLQNLDGTPKQLIGYTPPVLDGVWASAPYGHNGSWPTLWHALTTNKRSKLNAGLGEHYDLRPDVFAWSEDPDDYDLNLVGLKLKSDPEDVTAYLYKTRYNTERPGQSNEGHQFGNCMTNEERFAVIEFLKTLGGRDEMGEPLVSPHDQIETPKTEITGTISRFLGEGDVVFSDGYDCDYQQRNQPGFYVRVEGRYVGNESTFTDLGTGGTLPIRWFDIGKSQEGTFADSCDIEMYDEATDSWSVFASDVKRFESVDVPYSRRNAFDRSKGIRVANCKFEGSPVTPWLGYEWSRQNVGNWGPFRSQGAIPVVNTVAHPTNGNNADYAPGDVVPMTTWVTFGKTAKKMVNGNWSYFDDIWAGTAMSKEGWKRVTDENTGVFDDPSFAYVRTGRYTDKGQLLANNFTCELDVTQYLDADEDGYTDEGSVFAGSVPIPLENAVLVEPAEFGGVAYLRIDWQVDFSTLGVGFEVDENGNQWADVITYSNCYLNGTQKKDIAWDCGAHWTVEPAACKTSSFDNTLPLTHGWIYFSDYEPPQTSSSSSSTGSSSTSSTGGVTSSSSTSSTGGVTSSSSTSSTGGVTSSSSTSSTGGVTSSSSTSSTGGVTSSSSTSSTGGVTSSSSTSSTGGVTSSSSTSSTGGVTSSSSTSSTGGVTSSSSTSSTGGVTSSSSTSSTGGVTSSSSTSSTGGVTSSSSTSSTGGVTSSSSTSSSGGVTSSSSTSSSSTSSAGGVTSSSSTSSSGGVTSSSSTSSSGGVTSSSSTSSSSTSSSTSSGLPSTTSSSTSTSSGSSAEVIVCANPPGALLLGDICSSVNCCNEGLGLTCVGDVGAVYGMCQY